MNDKLLECCYQLKQKLQDNKDIIVLNKIDDQLQNDENAQCLAFLMQRSFDELSYLEDHFANEEEIKEKRQECQTHKTSLYQLDIVKSYHEQFNKVRLIYNYINDLIFKPLTKESHKCG